MTPTTPPAAPADVLIAQRFKVNGADLFPELDSGSTYVVVLATDHMAQVERLEVENAKAKKGDFWQGFEEGKREQQEMRELAETYRNKAEQERDAARAELAGLRGIAESAAQMVGVDYAVHRDETVAVIARELAAVRAGSGWVKCSERMPDDGQRVIVLTNVSQDREQIGSYFSPDSDYHPWNCGWVRLTKEEVTHWRPLPAVPGEGE
jgi:hypothetical protein